MADAPTARRRGRLRWIAVAATLLVVTLVAVAVVWEAADRRAAAALSAARDDLRAAGLSASKADFVASLDPVPDDANAAIELYAAAGRVDAGAEVWKTVNYAGTLPPFDYEPHPAVAADEAVATWADLLAALDANADAVDEFDGLHAKIRPAAGRVRANFGVDWGGPDAPMLAALYPDLNPQRDLASLLSYTMLADARRGDSGRVANLGLLMAGQADALGAGHPTMLGHLVTLGLDDQLSDTIARVAPVLAFGPASTNADPDDIRRLIAVLLDDGPRRDGWRRAVAGEIATQQDVVDHVVAGTEIDPAIGTSSPLWQARRPGLRSNGIAVAGMMRPLPAAADHDTHSAAAAVLDGYEDALADFETGPDVRRAAWAFMPSMGGAGKAHFRGRNLRRLAAVSLAVQLYRHDHGGLPPSLAALVPGYLPAVPRDAMAADAPVNYDPARGLAWAVGVDGHDEVVRLSR